MDKAKSFTDLIAWKRSHQLVIEIYKMTKTFPKEETYALSDQIRRASISISSNLAEGFNRHSKKEKTQFYYVALSSLTELQNQLLISRDVGYLSKEVFNDIAARTVEVSKLINGLVKSLKR